MIEPSGRLQRIFSTGVDGRSLRESHAIQPKALTGTRPADGQDQVGQAKPASTGTGRLRCGARKRSR